MHNRSANAVHATFKGKTMKRRLIKSLLSAACIAAPLTATMAAPAQAQSVMRPANDVLLSVGRGQLVTVPGSMANIFVANDAVADVEVKSARQLYVFGKSGGETTVYASNASGDVVWSANVRVGSNIDSVDQMLRLAMPEAKIGVSTMGTGTFLLTGTVAAPEDAAEAERLVSAFVGQGANVISRLKMATPLQVNLQVRIAEVSRSLVRDIGTNLASVDPTSGFKFGIGRGRSFFPQYTPGGPLGMATEGPAGTTVISPLVGATTLGFNGNLLGMNILGALDLGERVGLVTTLAQPNLTALSGETADFLAGGEFPIPLSQGLGTTTIEYKKFGVSLSYTPTVLANGRISLRVRPEVSELSSQNAITLNSFQVPSLTVRRAETTVELGSGQSFMIGGLLSNNSQNTIEKTPGAGDIPILGNLFRSTSYRRGETELVIVVTPYLVNPVNANDIKLPTDGFRAPNELQRLFGNMENDGVSGETRPMPSAAPDRTVSPNVGAADTSGATAGKDSKRDRRSGGDAAAPGFNLK